MNKQSVIVLNIPVLFKILNEIKDCLNFDLYEFKNLDNLEKINKTKYGNYLIILNIKVQNL